MKNIYEVLREKESQLRQAQAEVEALRIAAPLLADAKEETENVNGNPRRPNNPR